MQSIIDLLRRVKRRATRSFERAKWRLNPEFQGSLSRIKALHHSHFGEKAVILCNGPSLNTVRFDKLKGTFVIGLNKINLLFDKTDFRPSIIVAVNKHVIEQNRSFYTSTSIPLFLSHRSKKEIPSHPHIAFLFMQQGWTFSEDAADFLDEGSTVTFAALQLAYYMGFRQVALVGADHTFAQKGRPNDLVIADGPDENHFHPDYFGKGVPWQLADLEGSEIAYRAARAAMERSNGTIYNATEGGKLEIFKRLPLDRFLAL